MVRITLAVNILFLYTSYYTVFHVSLCSIIDKHETTYKSGHYILMQYQIVPVFISNEEGHLQCAMTTFGF